METSGVRSTCLWGMPFLSATAVLPFLPVKQSVQLTLQCRIPYLTREAFKSHAAVLRI
jgi:hypothetical protein